MAEITALHEDFEAGADGDIIDIATTIFNSITGPGPDAIYIDNGYEGDLGMQITSVGGQNKYYRTDITSESGFWMGFGVRMGMLPTVTTTIAGGYQGSTIGFTIRLTTLGEVQLRDGTVARFTSPALTVNEWYWISLKFIPGSSTGAYLKVYDRAATNVYDSGQGVATSTTATAIDNVRVGYLAGTGDIIVALDKLRADTTTEIPPVAAGSSNLTVVVEASPASPEADQVVTLTTTASGGVSPYTYAWLQVAGTTVSLSGSGASRTFTAPALINAETLSFQCTVTPTSGSAVAEVGEVPVLPHNFWTKRSGTLVPRRVKTMRGGNLVG